MSPEDHAFSDVGYLRSLVPHDASREPLWRAGWGIRAVLNKPFDQIDAADVAELLEHSGAHESLTLEFKRELSGRDGKQPDPG